MQAELCRINREQRRNRNTTFLNFDSPLTDGLVMLWIPSMNVVYGQPEIREARQESFKDMN